MSRKKTPLQEDWSIVLYGNNNNNNNNDSLEVSFEQQSKSSSSIRSGGGGDDDVVNNYCVNSNRNHDDIEIERRPYFEDHCTCWSHPLNWKKMQLNKKVTGTPKPSNFNNTTVASSKFKSFTTTWYNKNLSSNSTRIKSNKHQLNSNHYNLATKNHHSCPKTSSRSYKTEEQEIQMVLSDSYAVPTETMSEDDSVSPIDDDSSRMMDNMVVVRKKYVVGLSSAVIVLLGFVLGFTVHHLTASTPSFSSWLNNIDSTTTMTSPSSNPSSMSPTDMPSSHPTFIKSMHPTNTISFVPGELTVHDQNGLLLSTGLKSRIIAETGKRVRYADGRESLIEFHEAPDAGACFSYPGEHSHPNIPHRHHDQHFLLSNNNQGGWIYVSNSEQKDGEGGVGALTFNADGDVIGYQMVLTGTSRNCGGGKTPWGTWLTGEESGNKGQVHEVDPFGVYSANITSIGGLGGNYESLAYDDRHFPTLRFFLTEDSPNGELRRFTPNPSTISQAMHDKEYWKILTDDDGVIDYLVLNPSSDDDVNIGTFIWSTDEEEAQVNASRYFPNSEGIDSRNGFLFFVSKEKKMLFTLDLDSQSYHATSTQRGAFDGQPDQIKYLTGDSSTSGGLLYFCEEGGHHKGVHGRNSQGDYFTILEGLKYDTETTGLAFSPDRRRMYVSFQFDPGIIFEITREDELPFDGQVLDIKYHASTQLAIS